MEERDHAGFSKSTGEGDPRAACLGEGVRHACELCARSEDTSASASPSSFSSIERTDFAHDSRSFFPSADCGSERRSSGRSSTEKSSVRYVIGVSASEGETTRSCSVGWDAGWCRLGSQTRQIAYRKL